MRVLMLSIDSKILKDGTSARKKMEEYGAIVDELHIIVYTKEREGFDEKQRIAKNVWAYPTNTKFRPAYYIKGFKLAHTILVRSYSLRDDKWLITSQEGLTNILAVLLKWYHHIPLQVQVHTDISSKFFRKELKNKFRLIGYRIGITFADGVRVVSRRVKEYLVDKGFDKSKIVVLPMRTDIAETHGGGKFNLHKEYPQFEFIFLMVSRLEREKNIKMAIASLSKLVEKYPKTGLVIVGSGSLLDKLKKYAQKRDVASNVMFVGWLNDPGQYFKTADAFLQTSNYEGYGLTLVEAARAGLPIITTDVGLVGDWMSDKNALVIPVGNEKRLVECMSSLVINPRFCNLLSSKIRKAVPDTHLNGYLNTHQKSWQLLVNEGS